MCGHLDQIPKPPAWPPEKEGSGGTASFAQASPIDGWNSNAAPLMNEDERVDDFARFLLPRSSNDSYAQSVALPDLTHHHDGARNRLVDCLTVLLDFLAGRLLSFN